MRENVGFEPAVDSLHYSNMTSNVITYTIL